MTNLMHMFTRSILLSPKIEMTANMVELVEVDLSKYMTAEKIATDLLQSNPEL
jgi:hypothetical protein